MPGLSIRLGGALPMCAGLALTLLPGGRPASGLDAPSAQSQSSPQQPVFRAGTAVVEVDVYPTRDGRVIEGLTRDDVEVRENGAPQAIEGFDFVRVEPYAAEPVRDPNSTREMLERVADPRNRAFVLYLDRFHVRVGGSHAARSAVVDFLHRSLAPNDLLAVLTTGTPVSRLTFGRRTETIEQELTRYWWYWPERSMPRREEAEERLAECFEYTPPPMVLERWSGDGAVDRPLMDVIRMRWREDQVLTHLEDLVAHLGSIRETRKVLIVLTEGWLLFGPDQATAERILGPQGTGLAGQTPAVGRVGGRLVTTPPEEYVTGTECATEFSRLMRLENALRFQDIMRLANQHNVTFYPVNPSGLQAFDSAANERMRVVNPDAFMVQELGRVQGRLENLQTLAENTDGLAAVDNNLAAGLRRVVDDVSAYYVLTYTSSNPKPDGTYRRIEVRVKQADVRVRARRGYWAPSEAPARVVGAGPDASAAAREEAFGVLARLRREVPLLATGTVAGAEAAVTVELSGERALRASGATPVVVTLVAPDGRESGRGETRIEPGRRGTLVRIAVDPDEPGPWLAGIAAGAGRDRLQDSLEVRRSAGVLAGGAIVFRATPSPRSTLVPAADHLFRRTERVHVEWPALGDVDRREARLLARDGSPLAVPVSVTERDVDGRAVVAADLNLAPLADGEYAIELTVGQGDRIERHVVAIRVTR
jgi:VWFA-related protein